MADLGARLRQFEVAPKNTDPAAADLTGGQPATARRKPRVVGNFFLLILFLSFILTFWLGARGLNEPDEGRYGAMAAGLAEGQSDWWEPKLSGLGHYDKPPLIYWVTALSFRAFGLNEWAARAPSLLGAGLTLLGVGWTASRLYGREIAWWSVLICGTLGQFWLLARFLTPDMLLTGWCTLAIASWAECRHRNHAWGWWLLSLVFWTLAWWTKATAALVPLFGLAVGIRILRDESGKKALRLALLLPGILVLGSPWYVRMILQHEELLGFFFGRELLGRVLGHVTGRTGPVYYYVALSWVAWLPWLPLIALLGVSQARRWPQRTWRSAVRSAGWEGWIVASGFLIFSLISSKLPTYTLPLAPWAAVFMARLVTKLQSWMKPASVLRWSFLTVAVYGTLLLSASILAPRLEAEFGLNSSMRPVATALRQRSAQMVVMDRYWPGMEFYFGKRLLYLVSKSPRQVGTDRDRSEPVWGEHFWPADRWKEFVAQMKGEEIWLVRYVKNRHSPTVLGHDSARVSQGIRVGDFMLSRVVK